MPPVPIYKPGQSDQALREENKVSWPRTQHSHPGRAWKRTSWSSVRRSNHLATTSVRALPSVDMRRTKDKAASKPLKYQWQV